MLYQFGFYQMIKKNFKKLNSKTSLKSKHNDDRFSEPLKSLFPQLANYITKKENRTENKFEQS